MFNLITIKTRTMRVRIILSMLISSLILVSFSSSVNNEIEFQHLSLEEAKVLAKKSGKYIFIDCYTLWCGPCKIMAATSFKDEEVAKLYNDKFINLKVEMEKDDDGAEITRRYQIKAYPTLLIIDHEGKLIKQRIGMQSKDGLISFANSVIK